MTTRKKLLIGLSAVFALAIGGIAISPVVHRAAEPAHGKLGWSPTWGGGSGSGLSPIAAHAVLANPTGSTALPTAVTLGSGLAFTGSTLDTTITASSDIRTVLVAPAQTIDLTLNGDLDGGYIVRGYLKHAAATGVTTWSFRTNQQTAGLTGVDYLLSAAGGGGSGALTTGLIRIGGSGVGISNSATFNFTGFLWAKSGRIRRFSFGLGDGALVSGTEYAVAASLNWSDTATNLTSFGLTSDTAADFAVGSEIIATPMNTSQ